ncbi:hypothetical protein HIM_11729 [Hirsutella minnesotensis 3608]|uniref:Uncharacterized protein n=1 Tax=Hirsutella minnesotensis 3608 TaxID=1043627 RepID=A0A0F7ZIU0_9HYPO|nr:hypothetical protein HIM_11729 [Hirsutella minnesotensis 3608]
MAFDQALAHAMLWYMAFICQFLLELALGFLVIFVVFAICLINNGFISWHNFCRCLPSIARCKSLLSRPAFLRPKPKNCRCKHNHIPWYHFFKKPPPPEEEPCRRPRSQCDEVRRLAAVLEQAKTDFEKALAEEISKREEIDRQRRRLGGELGLAKARVDIVTERNEALDRELVAYRRHVARDKAELKGLEVPVEALAPLADQQERNAKLVARNAILTHQLANARKAAGDYQSLAVPLARETLMKLEKKIARLEDQLAQADASRDLATQLRIQVTETKFKNMQLTVKLKKQTAQVETLTKAYEQVMQTQARTKRELKADLLRRFQVRMAEVEHVLWKVRPLQDLQRERDDWKKRFGHSQDAHAHALRMWSSSAGRLELLRNKLATERAKRLGMEEPIWATNANGEEDVEKLAQFNATRKLRSMATQTE